MIDSIEDLQQAVVNNERNYRQYGHVKYVEKDGLILFNYTPEAQFEDRWNYFEQISRGLILDAKTGEIVARPFDKFWNWGERGRYGKGDIVTVTEKMDGSLGILFKHKGKYRIATRGAFDSEQAHWATEFFNKHYQSFQQIVDRRHTDWTWLFEIIYPENRVVVKYDEERLVLLGIRHVKMGNYMPYYLMKILADGFDIDIVPAATFHSITDIIEATEQIDATQEGWVVELSDGSRWKFKGDDYFELHKLISGLSFKKAAQAVKENNVPEVLAAVPDEFLDEFKQWVADVEYDYNYILGAVNTAYALAPKGSRKEFALWVNENHKDIAPYLFRVYDGNDFKDILFRRHFGV